MNEYELAFLKEETRKFIANFYALNDEDGGKNERQEEGNKVMMDEKMQKAILLVNDLERKLEWCDRDIFSRLPSDMLRLIFSSLTLKSILCLYLVCSRFRIIIRQEKWIERKACAKWEKQEYHLLYRPFEDVEQIIIDSAEYGWNMFLFALCFIRMYKNGYAHRECEIFQGKKIFYRDAYRDIRPLLNQFEPIPLGVKPYSETFVLLFGFMDNNGFCNNSFVLMGGNFYIGGCNKFIPHGKGMSRKAHGCIYRGDFHNGQRHGLGTHRNQAGRIYHGQYVDGKKKGHGRWIFPNGNYLQGQIQDNNKLQGQYVTSNDLWIEGEFFRKQLQGPIKLYYGQQLLLETIFDGGTPIDKQFHYHPVIWDKIQKKQCTRIGIEKGQPYWQLLSKCISCHDRLLYCYTCRNTCHSKSHAVYTQWYWGNEICECSASKKKCRFLSKS